MPVPALSVSALLNLRRKHLEQIVLAFEDYDTAWAKATSESLTEVNEMLARHGVHPPAFPIGLIISPAKTIEEERVIERAIDHACSL